MGMSIKEAIGLLERGSQYNYYDSAEDFCKAYDMSMETMRKYQKIEQILDDCDLEAWEVLEMIRKAVEDG